MAESNTITCKQFTSFLDTQTPVYDKEILKDIRPADTMMGYFPTAPFNAYTSYQHVYDRFKSVYPNTTAAWEDFDPSACTGLPCDPEANKIGWGYERNTYGLRRQSWESQLLCFDQILTRTQAKEHLQQIIGSVLRPATNTIMSDYILKEMLAAAQVKFSVQAGLPEFTYTWSPGGYVTFNTSHNPTGRLTPDILRSRVRRLVFLGATKIENSKYGKLELLTDQDTLFYLQKQDPVLLDAWRFSEFEPAAKEYYEYGLTGWVGNFMVKVLQFPLRFNKVSAGVYQVVLPYKNESVTEGIGSFYNEDYNNAQYQISYIVNRRAMKIMPFRAEAVNPMMPFLVRDYGGKWNFATRDLGADCDGQPINNMRQNKGKFYADFQLAIKPEHNEWMEAIFHMVDKPCIDIVQVCNDDPGYPAQDYNSANTLCPQNQEFVAAADADDLFVIATNTITCNGNPIAHAAISEGTLADLVDALNAAIPSLGTWTVVDATTLTFGLEGSSCSTVNVPFVDPVVE